MLLVEYREINTKTADYSKGQSGTPYYDATNGEFRKVIEWSDKIENSPQELIQLFSQTPQTSIWWQHPNKLLRRNAKAGKGRYGTPEERVLEMLEKIDLARKPVIQKRNWEMPKPCFDKYNLVVEMGFDLLGMPEYADNYKISWSKFVPNSISKRWHGLVEVEEAGDV